MSRWFDWAFVPLMLGIGVIGFLLGFIVVEQDYQLKLHEQIAHYQLDAVKKNMTTLLQLQECHFEEAFYTLDREIYLAHQKFENPNVATELIEPYRAADLWVLDYYQRFNLEPQCEDCVPRSPVPRITCLSI